MYLTLLLNTCISQIDVFFEVINKKLMNILRLNEGIRVFGGKNDKYLRLNGFYINGVGPKMHVMYPGSG
jgi:hypothetical protein